MAATAVTTTMAGAINYTYVTDTSADWASVPNSTYFYDKADKLVHYKNSGGTVLEIFSAGGLTYFTEAQSTAAPNATVNVDSFTAVASTTNADIALVPKGTGAFTLAIPDGTATGGNKRGDNAIDLQTVRSNAAMVASGYQSVVVGTYSRASGTNSVAIGSGNSSFNASAINTQAYAIGPWTTASQPRALALGNRVTSSGDGSCAIGGAYYVETLASGDSSTAINGGNQAISGFSCAIGGSGNLANGFASYASGTASSTQGITGRHSRGYYNTIQGDCQKSEFFLSKRTTDATATTITVNGGVAGATNQVILQNQSAYRFKGTIIGKQSGSTNTAAWDVDGLIVRGANAAATTLIVGNVNLVSNAPAWGVPTLTADTTNGGLQVQVTGAVGTNIQWTAVIDTTEVIYA